jgi:tetratricopeptide (TPR) repeat protein
MTRPCSARLLTTPLLGLALAACGGQADGDLPFSTRNDSTPVLATLAEPTGTGSAQLRSGDLSGARATYESMLTADPERLSALNDLAVTYYLAGRLDAARELLDEVVAGGGARDQQAALVNLGELYAIEGYVSAAQAYFESARSIDPSSPTPSYALGLLADARGDGQGALALVREALKSDETGSARLNHAFLCPEERAHLDALVAEAQGERDQAAEHWRELKSGRWPALAVAAQRHLDETQ